MTTVTQASDAPTERMWPLDLSIAALATLVLYLVLSQFSFDDQRWQYNAWTYVIAVPLVALVLDLFVRGIASNYVHKSIQLGFLFSVLVHLMLLTLAVNVIIFSRYFPDAFTGVKPERSPVRRTVPEYLFKTSETRSTQPDWSKPTETETASPVIPQQQRQLPPVEHTAPLLEMPNLKDPVQRPIQKHLVEREKPAESLPQPSDSPAKLARRSITAPENVDVAAASPVVPDVPMAAEVDSASVDRPVDNPTRRSPTKVTRQIPSPAMLPDTSKPNSVNAPALAGARQRSEALPRVGDSGVMRQRRDRSEMRRPTPAGSAPAPPTVAVAKLVDAADRMISPVESPLSRQGEAVGAQLTLGETPSVASTSSSENDLAGQRRTGNDLAVAAGGPNVTAGNAMRASGASRLSGPATGFSPAGVPDASGDFATADIRSAVESPSSEVSERSLSTMPTRSPSSRDTTRELSASSMAGPTIDLPIEEGPIGLADLRSRSTGVVPSIEALSIASVDLTSGSRRRRDVGGPVVPVGSKIAAVESFSRRVMRTEGGQVPTPAGMVGPATEEAIERGLAYLASIQNKDGSWSLQGHGTEVVLKSDTAATGLCLLAFQGAGYTHLEHQYADTVSLGLKFLIDNQRTNGDLFRSEDPLSDQNVAFYSHGIASLAMCEAYGMTQDEELKEPAQGCLNFIAGTQNRSRGGWRYVPQVSSDTSVSGWMMMALKSGQLSGLEVSAKTYEGINRWLDLAQSPDREDRYRYNPYAPDTPSQRHGRLPTPTMTSVGMLMRMYAGWRRDTPAMQSAAEYLLEYPPQMGSAKSPQRDAYYWYYATQVMFHMGGDYWKRWNQSLNPVLLESQLNEGAEAGSWDPINPVPDRWSVHAGRLYVTTMNLLNLEVYYRHLPIYEETAE
ncbi:Prenyltransferase and squalene oxidase repeat protein [Rubripirellula tenax]|uniref:Prenyltransferase and squalene oxidase repeat protein n=1 Tax=Rubripirellula tenax TaxID=2528015 RepID=A0A5C6ELY4_9BACT|nr:prenyltransferase/squalene oxidase repeat-containing protein [Rubripirellula tenax]TWU50763.1 Prenyltransferase and squalene oxidase repeat protein [Rubripirellula tenax]